MSEVPFFHEASGTVRFWVEVDAQWIGASIGKETLHYHYRPGPATSLRWTPTPGMRSPSRRRFAIAWRKVRANP